MVLVNFFALFLPVSMYISGLPNSKYTFMEQRKDELFHNNWDKILPSSQTRRFPERSHLTPPITVNMRAQERPFSGPSFPKSSVRLV